MIHLRPTSLIQFTRDALAALPPAENRRLRKQNRDLWMENVSLSAVASDLAEQLATTRRALAQAVNHPCVRAADFDFDGPEPPEGVEFYEPPTFAQPIPDSEIAEGGWSA